ncbi:MAG: Sapep family Mn(2+)-dependent dipeptidase [Clostridia bacterium]|nr:Sapep family Mn(2+)-dependent dipeptidase [Clostridia bacterium]
MQGSFDLYMQEHRQEMIDALRALVKHPSVRRVSSPNAPFGQPVADALHTYLDLAKSFGFTTKNFNYFAGTVEWGGPAKLGILSHLDVVPEGTGWTYPPFNVTEQEGYLYGRGVIDDKGPTIAALFALKAIKDLQIPLKKGVRLIVGCSEETGGEDMDYYKECEPFPPLLFTPDGDFPVINIEKGRFYPVFTANLAKTAAPCAVKEIHAGTVVNAVPETATAILHGISVEEIKQTIDHLGTHGLSFSFEESDYTLQMTVSGTAAHASTPEKGVNALTGLLKILSALDLDRCDSTEAIQMLAKWFPFGDVFGEALGLACQDECSGSLTCVLSCLIMTEDRLEAQIDIRFPLVCTKESLEKSFKSFEETSLFTITTTGVDPHHVPADSPFVRTLLDIYESVTGDAGCPIAIGGGTYVHGIPNAVAFGAEYPGDDNHMHGADERLAIDKWLQTATIYAQTIYTLCSE